MNKSLTRSTRFEVRLDGVRNSDKNLLYARLRGAQEDLRLAATTLLRAQYHLDRGILEHPVNKDKKPIPKLTLSYHAIQAIPKWQPFGDPIYRAREISYWDGNKRKKVDNYRVASGISIALTSIVQTRTKDFKDVTAGKKQLSNFRKGGIPYAAAAIRLREDNSFRLTTWSEKDAPKNQGVSIRPVKLDNSIKSILDKCRKGTYKMGSAILLWDDRKNKWFFSLSYTDENHVIEEPPVENDAKYVVAGIDIGIRHAAWIAFIDQDQKVLKRSVPIQWPQRMLRSVERTIQDRRQRSFANRADLEQRAGKGRTKKLRSTATIANKQRRLTKEMIRQLAAGCVKECQKREVKLVVIEDHAHWAMEKMHARADNFTRKEAAEYRKNFMRMHSGEMRKQLMEVFEKAGIKCIAVDPAWTSRTCHECKTIWKRDFMRNPLQEGENAYGRVTQDTFVCECGFKGNADRNAAINIARRGIEHHHDESRWKVPSNHRSLLLGKKGVKILEDSGYKIKEAAN